MVYRTRLKKSKCKRRLSRKHKSPARKSSKRKSPARKSPKRKSPARKSPKRKSQSSNSAKKRFGSPRRSRAVKSSKTTSHAAYRKTHEVIRKNNKRILIFTLPVCYYCSEAKRALRAAGIPPSLITTAPMKPHRDALLDRFGSRCAPSVFVRGKYVGGCEDGPLRWHGVKKMLANGKLQKMLA